MSDLLIHSMHPYMMMAPYAAAAAPYLYNGWYRYRHGWGPNYGIGMGGYGYMPFSNAMMGYGWL